VSHTVSTGVEDCVKGSGINGVELHALIKLFRRLGVSVEAFRHVSQEIVATRSRVAGRSSSFGGSYSDDAPKITVTEGREARMAGCQLVWLAAVLHDWGARAARQPLGSPRIYEIFWFAIILQRILISNILMLVVVVMHGV